MLLRRTTGSLVLETSKLGLKLTHLFFKDVDVLGAGRAAGFVVAEAAGWTRWSSGTIAVRIGRKLLRRTRAPGVAAVLAVITRVVRAAAARAVTLGRSDGGSEGGWRASEARGGRLHKQPEKRFGQH